MGDKTPSKVSKEIEEVKSEYRRNKILAIGTLAIIFIIVGIGLYFYFQSGILPQTNETTESSLNNESSLPEPERQPETTGNESSLPEPERQPGTTGNESSLPEPPR